MRACEARLSDGNPCPKTAEEGKTLCRWHDPDDENWREVYAILQNATSKEKTNIVLGLIEEHPEHKLVLPERDGWKADLSGVDLSPETLDSRVSQQSSWFGYSLLPSSAINLSGAKLRGANLERAKLQHVHLELADLQGSNLGKAQLQRAHLSEANLEGANLNRANLEAAELIDANLSRANLGYANLQDAQLGDTNLQGSVLAEANLRDAQLGGANLSGSNADRADFRGAFLQVANFAEASLVGVNFQGARLTYADLHGADLREAKLQGVDLTSINLLNIYISEAWLEKTRIRQEDLGDEIGEEREGRNSPRPQGTFSQLDYYKLVHDYAAAKRGYLALKQNFDDLGDYEAASWAYRKERRMEKLEAWHNGRHLASMAYGRYWLFTRFNRRKIVASYLKFSSDTLVEWLCDYGESAWRVIDWMAALLFIVGPLLFSSLGGIVWNEELTREFFAASSSSKFWLWYRTYLLYTLDTLTTANFSGLQPINDAVKLASGFFAIAGIVLAGLLGFVAGNRIRRS